MHIDKASLSGLLDLECSHEAATGVCTSELEIAKDDALSAFDSLSSAKTLRSEAEGERRLTK